nr:DUF1294 domain-containing protein [Gorillibacterium massiliense]
MFTALTLYIVVVNIIAFFLMGSDKARARKKKRRVPEARLFGLAAIGGALGIMLGMNRFRHKTLHNSFRLGIPLLLIWNAAATGYLYTVIGK